MALENNIKFEHIPSGKIRRYFDLRNFYEPLKNLT
jgi:UDP-N-acetylglucosamine:LPS N-acetylglucosamine transferase